MKRDDTEKRDEDHLEQFFQAARAEPPMPSSSYMDKLMVQAAQTQLENAPQPRFKWRVFLDGVGGWLGGAGLASAMALGVMIGISTPAELFVVGGEQMTELEEFLWLDDYAMATWDEL